MAKGKLIVIEGIDGSGKATQARELTSRLKKGGEKVFSMDFPQYYKNFFGAMVARYLQGEFGRAQEVSPYLASILYAGDRWEAKQAINKKLLGGYTVILDRYYTSSLIHQGGKFKSRKKKRDFFNWLEEMELKVFMVPKPDIVIFLDVPCMVAKRLVGKKSARAYTKGRKRDIHEKDDEHMRAAYQQAISLCRQREDWYRIKCHRDGGILSISEISDKIHSFVKKAF